MPLHYREKIYPQYRGTAQDVEKIEQEKNALRQHFPMYHTYFIRHLPKDRTIKILEIGCGCGGMIYYLQQLGYIHARGIDISEEQIAAAHALHITNVERADALNFLKDRAEQYDVIIANDVLEHFKKEEVLCLLDSMYASLSAGGRIIIKTVNGQGVFASSIRYGDFTHEIALTPSSLETLFRVTGFKRSLFLPTRPVVHGIKSGLRYMVWYVLESVVRCYLLVETGSGRGIFTQNMIAVAEKS